MTTASTEVRGATVARLIHGSLIMGIVLFAIVTVTMIRPQRADIVLPPVALNALLGLSLAASAASLLLRGRVPRRSTTDSPDLFWSTAFPKAMVVWAPLEAGALLGIVAYLLYGSTPGLALAAVALLGMIVLNPGRLERA